MPRTSLGRPANPSAAVSTAYHPRVSGDWSNVPEDVHAALEDLAAMGGSGPHTIASHSDTTATGSELDTLTNGDDADSLHAHAISTARLQFFQGTFLESLNALNTATGGVITLSLEKSGGGDLTMVFSDGHTTLDCTPALTINSTGASENDLTEGSDTSPTENYVYIPQATKVLTVSTCD